MAQAVHYSHYLPRKGLDSLAKGLIGKLKPVLAVDEVALPFALLDTFVQSLRRSGRMLLEAGGRFELLTPDGMAISSPISGTGRSSRLWRTCHA